METKWTPEQQKEHRKLWVEALRSGKYQQAKGQLAAGGGFCCLGVACEVSGFRYDPDYISLPQDVMEWLGVAVSNGEYRDGNDTTYLTDQNDTLGKTFAEIADIIESEPPGLIANA
jgi:hypothetical protein